MDTADHGAKDATDTEIAGRIASALLIKSMTVKALSEETGISYPTLRRSLRGGRSLTFNEFGKIAQALKIPPSALLPDNLAERSAA